MKNLWESDLKPNWNLIGEKDWFIAMQDCPQDPTFHAEGDVGLHTQMVVEALMGLEEFQDLSRYDQEVLLWSALLHDVAKPQCTRTDEDGYIRAPKHTEVGEKVARQMLWNIDFDSRELICSYVRLHGLPIWCLDKENCYRWAALSSSRLNNQYLYLLAKADVLGRESTGKDDFLERVEFFKEFCIEQECWDQPKSFHNPHSKFKFFFKNDFFPAEIYDDTKFEIIILAGLPGSGKDTYVKSLNHPMISLDEIRKELGIKHSDKKRQGKVAQLAYQRAKDYAAKGRTFIWNSTNITRELRLRIISALSVYNPRFRLVYVETSKENIFSRRKEDIPKRKIEKMFKMLEMPLSYEVHDIEYFRN